MRTTRPSADGKKQSGGLFLSVRLANPSSPTNRVPRYADAYRGFIFYKALFLAFKRYLICTHKSTECLGTQTRIEVSFL